MKYDLAVCGDKAKRDVFLVVCRNGAKMSARAEVR